MDALVALAVVGPPLGIVVILGVVLKFFIGSGEPTDVDEHQADQATGGGSAGSSQRETPRRPHTTGDVPRLPAAIGAGRSRADDTGVAPAVARGSIVPTADNAPAKPRPSMVSEAVSRRSEALSMLVEHQRSTGMAPAEQPSSADSEAASSRDDADKKTKKTKKSVSGLFARNKGQHPVAASQDSPTPQPTPVEAQATAHSAAAAPGLQRAQGVQTEQPSRGMQHARGLQRAHGVQPAHNDDQTQGGLQAQPVHTAQPIQPAQPAHPAGIFAGRDGAAKDAPLAPATPAPQPAFHAAAVPLAPARGFAQPKPSRVDPATGRIQVQPTQAAVTGRRASDPFTEAIEAVAAAGDSPATGSSPRGAWTNKPVSAESPEKVAAQQARAVARDEALTAAEPHRAEEPPVLTPQAAAAAASTPHRVPDKTAARLFSEALAQHTGDLPSDNAVAYTGTAGSQNASTSSGDWAAAVPPAHDDQVAAVVRDQSVAAEAGSPSQPEQMHIRMTSTIIPTIPAESDAEPQVLPATFFFDSIAVHDVPVNPALVADDVAESELDAERAASETVPAGIDYDSAAFDGAAVEPAQGVVPDRVVDVRDDALAGAVVDLDALVEGTVQPEPLSAQEPAHEAQREPLDHQVADEQSQPHEAMGSELLAYPAMSEESANDNSSASQVSEESVPPVVIASAEELVIDENFDFLPEPEFTTEQGYRAAHEREPAAPGRWRALGGSDDTDWNLEAGEGFGVADVAGADASTRSPEPGQDAVAPTHADDDVSAEHVSEQSDFAHDPSEEQVDGVASQWLSTPADDASAGSAEPSEESSYFLGSDLGDLDPAAAHLGFSGGDEMPLPPIAAEITAESNERDNSVENSAYTYSNYSDGSYSRSGSVYTYGGDFEGDTVHHAVESSPRVHGARHGRDYSESVDYLEPIPFVDPIEDDGDEHNAQVEKADDAYATIGFAESTDFWEGAAELESAAAPYLTYDDSEDTFDMGDDDHGTSGFKSRRELRLEREAANMVVPGTDYEESVTSNSQGDDDLAEVTPIRLRSERRLRKEREAERRRRLLIDADPHAVRIGEF